MKIRIRRLTTALALAGSLALLSCQTAPESGDMSNQTSTGLTTAERSASLVERTTAMFSSPSGKWILGIGGAAIGIYALSQILGGDDDGGGSSGGSALRVQGDRLNQELRISTWFHACQLAPAEIATNDSNCYRIGDNHVKRWLNATKNAGANAVELMVSGFIMNGDGSINQAWAQRMKWFVNEAASRDIYVGLQAGNYWGKGAGNSTQTGHSQMLNWWTGPDAKIRSYIDYVGKNLIGRNTFVVFNEMDHSGLGGAWKAHARTYVDLIHQACSCIVPVGISEGGAWIGGPHIVKLAHNEGQFAPGGAWGYDEQAGGSGRWDWNPGRAAEYAAANKRARQLGSSIFSVSSWTPDKRGPIPTDWLQQVRAMQ